ncbi:DUF2946 domain-containing protein [Burkholderia cepacia]|uniref:DUF2946 domain-containing protein n=1 Tax=Burkholderia cepacia TaxID=292 RepID=UPI001CF34202|nr:DUF2946 domain-containing protein [Burkholderia cepacia]MCA8280852.1 DUF2946 domain-containing protein [Burkholderia cepacia]
MTVLPPLSSVTRTMRRAAWVAVFAVLLNALAPAITSVRAAWRDDAATTRAVLQLAPLADASHGAHAGQAGTPARDTGTHHGCGDDTCPFCHVHAGSFGLPPLPPQAVPLLAFAERPLAARARMLRHVPPWPHAFSRGPPSAG